MPPFFEAGCAAIVALSVAVALARASSAGRLARRLLLLSVAAWLGEDSMIHAYAAYDYAPGWRGFVDRVPVLIPLIWPIVIHSAWRLARGLSRSGREVSFIAVCGALLVLSDAAFIEPLAVATGLWRWNLPGPFAVPIIGVLGWSFFALAAIAWLERCERADEGNDLARTSPETRRGRCDHWHHSLAPRREVTILIAGPLVAHALVVASWWGLFRWLETIPGETTMAAAAWLAATVVVALELERGAGSRVFGELLARLPGAAVFFILIATLGDRTLVAYALAFVPPYLVLSIRTLIEERRASTGSS